MRLFLISSSILLLTEVWRSWKWPECGILLVPVNVSGMGGWVGSWPVSQSGASRVYLRPFVEWQISEYCCFPLHLELWEFEPEASNLNSGPRARSCWEPQDLNSRHLSQKQCLKAAFGPAQLVWKFLRRPFEFEKLHFSLMMAPEGLIQTRVPCGRPVRTCWWMCYDTPSHCILSFETALLEMSRTPFSDFIFIGVQESDNDAVWSPAA